ncbi:Hsp70 family protein [Paracidovorax citrulli]
MPHACGLDFGTSNSTVGWLRPGQPTLLPLEDGRDSLPSVLFFHAEEPLVRFGRAALADYLAGYEGRMMRSLKSVLGTSMIEESTELMGRPVPFRDLLAHFIGELKRRAEAAAGVSFDRAVLGRPVHFIDDDPGADRLAEDTLRAIAGAAGFAEVEFQFEPIAAAFDYEATMTEEALVLVVDIGGGTSDFSLVRLSPERADRADRRDDILANGGVHLGGTDFDQQLSLATAMPWLGLGGTLRTGKPMPSGYYFDLAAWHTINRIYTRKARTHVMDNYRDAADTAPLDRLLRLIDDRSGHWLAMQVEDAKIALSAREQTQMAMDRIAPGQTLTVSRAAFDAAVEKPIARIEAAVRTLLADAGVAPEQVDTVLFTGGSSGVPVLRERLSALLPAARKVEGDRFGGIGSGLALDARRKFG